MAWTTLSRLPGIRVEHFPSAKGAPMSTVVTIGLDLAKSVFQIHGVDDAGRTVLRRRLSRHELVPYFAKLPGCLVGMEACSAAHHWGARSQSRAEGILLTEAQIAALEKAKADKEAHGEFESECPGYCGAQDTFYVGTLKGVGRIYQQTFIDTYAKVAFAKLYDRKTPITAAEILNDRVVPFYDEHGIRLSRVLTDRGTEFCGTQSHDYELYLAVEDIDHSRTKTKSPQTNGICERFHRTVLDEFYRIAFRKKIYHTIDELQTDLDAWLVEYNSRRPHQGRWCFGKTPMQTFLDAIPLAKKKIMAA
jgi:transposase InsO family protein